MNKQTLVIIGLVGGIVAAVGVFLPWVNIFGFTSSGSGSNQGLVILLGGVLAMVGGIVALVVKNAPSAVSYLIPVGGLIALLSWLWFGADAGFGNLSNFSYGLWIALVGAILALVGTLGVMKK